LKGGSRYHDRKLWQSRIDRIRLNYGISYPMSLSMERLGITSRKKRLVPDTPAVLATRVGRIEPRFGAQFPNLSRMKSPSFTQRESVAPQMQCRQICQVKLISMLGVCLTHPLCSRFMLIHFCDRSIQSKKLCPISPVESPRK
jgi:hypothetical protein